jgi:hypothetical protein
MSGVQTLRSYQDVSAQAQTVAADSGVKALIAGRTGWTVYVQKIRINVTTTAAQTATVRAATTETVVLATVPSDPGIGVREFDFGEDGWALPSGEGLEQSLSAAGLAFAITVQAYMKLTPNTAITAAALAAS